MINISYTQSSQLEDSLKRINALHQNILLSVMSPKNELRLRWQATIERVFWSLSLSDNPLARTEVSKVLRQAYQNKTVTDLQKEVLVYKKAIDHINQTWLGSQKPTTIKDVTTLNQILSSGKLNIKSDSLKNSLAYFENSNEHPVIQAGLIHYQIYALSPSNSRNTRFSSLISYLFLYKEGFDCRGLIVLDEYFRRNFTDYQLLLKQAEESGAQTVWLEFFSKAVMTSLEKALENITENKVRPEVLNINFDLNERQKDILSHLENPDATITNRQIQKLYKISQITASRDLAKLASLLLIFSHGKGRSVYYTRI